MITPHDALLRLEDANPMPLPTDIDDDTFADVWAIIETGFDEAPAPAPQTLRQPAAPQWRRPIAVAAAAFVIVIAVIGIVALLRNAETPVAETSTTVAPKRRQLLPRPPPRPPLPRPRPQFLRPRRPPCLRSRHRSRSPGSGSPPRPPSRTAGSPP